MKINLKNNKVLILAVCTLLVLNFTLLTTLAWLTDSSEVVNTFTVGKVDIELEESDTDNDGDKHNNEYHLIPGEDCVKDPTMTVKAGSAESYLRIIMTVHNQPAVQKIIDNPKNDLDDYGDLLGGWDPAVWQYEGFTEDKAAKTISFEFRYKETVDGFNDENQPLNETLAALFTTLIVPETLTMEELNELYEGGFKIVLEGHAIQAAGFETADEAWAAFYEQVTKEEAGE